MPQPATTPTPRAKVGPPRSDTPECEGRTLAEGRAPSEVPNAWRRSARLALLKKSAPMVSRPATVVPGPQFPPDLIDRADERSDGSPTPTRPANRAKTAGSVRTKATTRPESNDLPVFSFGEEGGLSVSIDRLQEVVNGGGGDNSCWALASWAQIPQRVKDLRGWESIRDVRHDVALEMQRGSPQELLDRQAGLLLALKADPDFREELNAQRRARSAASSQAETVAEYASYVKDPGPSVSLAGRSSSRP